MKKVKGEYLVEMYDMKKDNDKIYMFLEFCPDGDLAEYIEKNGIKDPKSEHHPWLAFG